MTSSFDLTIIGGGLVGASLAVALSDHAFNIALVDASPLPLPKDHRLIALTKNSADFFSDIGVWAELKNDACAIQRVHVSQYKKFGFTELAASDIHLSELGFVVPAEKINQTLYQKLKNTNNITLLQPESVQQITHQQQTIALNFASGKKIETTLLIAADGTHSTLRELLNIPVETIDYQQRALVTVTHLQRDHQHIAYERFHKTGALALLPLTDHRAATIWTDSEKNIELLMNLSDQLFLKKLQNQMGYRAGRLLNIENRYTYPLKLIRIKPEHQIQNRVMLIGNAAHTIHPIAAQGLNIALNEIAFLKKHFEKISEMNLPEKLPEQKNILLSHQLTQIFATDFLPFNVAKQVGMTALDLLGMVKRKFMHRMIES